MRQAKTILLVDDDFGVRKVLSQSLEMDGYRVLEAHSGADAIRVYEQHVGAIDLLLSDIVMGGMSGIDLAERLKSSKPNLKVILMSGHFNGPLEGGWHFIEKPFSPAMVRDKVAHVLSDPIVGEKVPEVHQKDSH